jgi:hypothetical protein
MYAAYTGYFTSEPGKIENATHNTFQGERGYFKYRMFLTTRLCNKIALFLHLMLLIHLVF